VESCVARRTHPGSGRNNCAALLIIGLLSGLRVVWWGEGPRTGVGGGVALGEGGEFQPTCALIRASGMGGSKTNMVVAVNTTELKVEPMTRYPYRTHI